MLAQQTTDEERKRIRAIRATVKAHAESLRAEHPWLRHQDALGVVFLVVALGVHAGAAVGYGLGVLPAWACLLAVALAGSILHEIEHDLLHELYFKDQPRIQNAMMLVAWLPRPNLMNPWARRYIHRHHHRVSGTKTDVEEIAATNGLPMGARRILMMTCRTVRVLLSKSRTKSMVIDGVTIQHSWRDLPETIFDWLLIAFVARWLVTGVGAAFGFALPVPAAVTTVAHIIDFAGVVLVLPNLFRRFCLFFVTSNVHFHGDVRNLLEQTQVLDHWLFLPLNLFCFNFGATHAIHHFVVRQPFYLRQWVAPVAWEVMRENGVRFNDLGTFGRANRYLQEGRA